ncbi:30S ribosomal protein S15 [Thermoplasma sp.]|uniref:30S ribosomal protein S15 n=1 Tax=Thermoplasma sp. TaxID=1973142 RepID=UPI00127EDCE2|nr:30S ribosomal protein S15 [Thermoplasma sp.]KAA8922290.1 MAG: 30S ribosomal protein S15 [Thermoplasma sp.]
MARMHTRKRGRSGSKKVYGVQPSWIQYSKDEIVNTIVNLKKSGVPPSVIGIRLRDQYGIPTVKAVLGTKLGKILAEKGLKDEVPEDLSNLIRRYNNVAKHVELNPKDQANKRGRDLIMAKMLRLVKYYKRTGVLDEKWNLSKVLR